MPYSGESFYRLKPPVCALMLLVSRFGLVEENAIEVFHHYALLFLEVKFKVFSEKIIT